MLPAPTTPSLPPPRQAYGTCVAWGVHWVAAWLVLRAMGVPGVPWSELLAYTGYPFAAVVPAVLAQRLAGGRAQGRAQHSNQGLHAG